MRRRFPLAILVVLALVAGAEASVRLAHGKLREPLLWGNWETQNKVAAMDRLAAAGKHPSVVVVGSSMADVAADPLLMSRTLGPRALVFNASLGGADVRALERWTLGAVLPRLRPSRVVIGLSSREMNDHGLAQTRFYRAFTESVEGSRLATAGTPKSIESWFSRHSALIRYRHVLRNPLKLTGHENLQEVNAVTPLGMDQAFLDQRKGSFEVSPKFRLIFEQNTLNDFSIGGAQLAALDRLIAALRARRIAVTLVQMPVLDQYVAMHSGGRDDFDVFRSVLARYAKDSGVQYVDMRTAIGNNVGYFTDPVHMNDLGAALFSQLLAKVLLNPATDVAGAARSGSIVTVRNSDGAQERILLVATTQEKTAGTRTVTTRSGLGSSLVGKKPGDAVVVPRTPDVPVTPQPVETVEVVSVVPWDGTK